MSEVYLCPNLDAISDALIVPQVVRFPRGPAYISEIERLIEATEQELDMSSKSGEKPQ
jgi:hypothetical protein